MKKTCPNNHKFLNQNLAIDKEENDIYFVERLTNKQDARDCEGKG